MLCAVDLGPARDLVSRVLLRVSCDSRDIGCLCKGLEGWMGLFRERTYGLNVLALGGFRRHLGGVFLYVVVALPWC